MHLSDFIFFTVTLSAFAILTLIATWDHVGKYGDWEEKIHTVIHNRLTENKIIPSIPAFPKLTKRKLPACVCKDWATWNDMKLSIPPCCKEGYIRAFKSLKTYLDINNISYSLMNGTLLGAVRCGEMIQYDYNIDMKIYNTIGKSRDVLNSWHLKSPIFSNMTIIIKGLPWAENEFSGSSDMILYFNIEIDTKDSPPLYPCLFEGLKSSCVYNYQIILISLYGKDWMLPRRWTNSSALVLSKEIDMKQLNRCVDNRLKMNDNCKNMKNLIIGDKICGENITKKKAN
tara:strand:+ start:2299 stop:3156 length:858 start_codon:yes stop_codon:yes gene_type:complete